MKSDCYEYYYEIMKSEEREVYKTMYDGFVNNATDFVIPQCEYGKIGEIFEKLTDDHPEIFYVKSIQIQSGILFHGYCIIPQYRFSKDEISFLREKIKVEVDSIIKKCTDSSPIDAERMIHDYILKRVRVNYKDLDAPYSHEMPGVFLYGIGVCEGISKAFKYLCDRAGIRAGIVVGKTDGEDTAHAWNQICIDDRWYNVDVTFDANLSKLAGDIRYDYFNLSDAEMKDRSAFFPSHICNHYYGFYVKERKYAKCQSDLKSIVKKRRGNIISVQLPRIKCDSNQLQDYVFKTVSESLDGYGNHEICILPNYDTNVFTIMIHEKGLF